ncbi:glycogen synthase GlgA [Petrachloros mirabilis]
MNPSRSLNLLIAASEAIPYAKTGGLADVTGALPQELVRLGHDVILLLPGYRSINDSGRSFHQLDVLPVPTAQGIVNASIEEDIVPVRGCSKGLRVWAIRFDQYFDRAGFYQEKGKDYPDNLERFAFFSRAVIEIAAYLWRRQRWKTDILHLHDWQTSLCTVYLKTTDQDRPELEHIKTVLTLHNMGYQGLFPGSEFHKTGLPPSLFGIGGLEYYGSLNLLKGGIVFSDFLTTVSPTYAKEILTREGGCGLDGVLRNRQVDLQGILNGIDIEVWNPETDKFLSATYSVSDRTGKAVCKKALQREFRLPEVTVPVIAAIGRMTSQKGFDLMEAVIPQLMRLDVQLVMLGIGDPSYEERFRTLQMRYRDGFGLHIGFDEGLAHRIEGGADMLVMPSRYEPCGLSQLYSLRYGTVPIVRKTGGLADTVVPFDLQKADAGSATGFFIDEHTAESLLTSLGCALEVFQDAGQWNRLVETGMISDMSWARSATAYDELFASLEGM